MATSPTATVNAHFEAFGARDFVQRHTASDGQITSLRIFEDSLGPARAFTGEPVIASVG
jgi:hypothetical protein